VQVYDKMLSDMLPLLDAPSKEPTSSTSPPHISINDFLPELVGPPPCCKNSSDASAPLQDPAEMPLDPHPPLDEPPHEANNSQFLLRVSINDFLPQLRQVFGKMPTNLVHLLDESPHHPTSSKSHLRFLVQDVLPQLVPAEMPPLEPPLSSDSAFQVFSPMAVEGEMGYEQLVGMPEIAETDESVLTWMPQVMELLGVGEEDELREIIVRRQKMDWLRFLGFFDEQPDPDAEGPAVQPEEQPVDPLQTSLFLDDPVDHAMAEDGLQVLGHEVLVEANENADDLVDEGYFSDPDFVPNEVDDAVITELEMNPEVQQWLLEQVQGPVAEQQFEVEPVHRPLEFEVDVPALQVIGKRSREEFQATYYVQDDFARMTASPSKETTLSKRQRSARLSKLRQHHVEVRSIHKNLRSGVVGDYLERRRPSKNLLAVVKSFQTSKLLEAVMPATIKPRAWLQPVLEKSRCRNRYGAARALLGALHTTRRNMSLMNRVFGALWHSIFTAPDQRQDALTCNELFRFSARKHIDWQLSNRDLKAEVAFGLETRYQLDGHAIVNDPAIQYVWARVREFPNYPIDADTLTTEIHAFLEQRRLGQLHSNLDAEFLKHNVFLPRSTRGSRPEALKIYDQGGWFCKPVEIVALTQVMQVFEEAIPSSHFCDTDCPCESTKHNIIAWLVEEVHKGGHADDNKWMEAAGKVRAILLSPPEEDINSALDFM
ncbi:hypothetical protein HDU96_002326, partial [Phlyctochytrium bullatum]